MAEGVSSELDLVTRIKGVPEKNTEIRVRAWGVWGDKMEPSGAEPRLGAGPRLEESCALL